MSRAVRDLSLLEKNSAGEATGRSYFRHARSPPSFTGKPNDVRSATRESGIGVANGPEGLCAHRALRGEYVGSGSHAT